MFHYAKKAAAVTTFVSNYPFLGLMGRMYCYKKYRTGWA